MEVWLEAIVKMVDNKLAYKGSVVISFNEDILVLYCNYDEQMVDNNLACMGECSFLRQRRWFGTCVAIYTV